MAGNSENYYKTAKGNWVKTKDGIIIEASNAKHIGENEAHLDTDVYKMQGEQQAQQANPQKSGLLDYAAFGIAPMTATYLDVMGNPFEKSLPKMVGTLAGATPFAAGDAALNLSMFSGVGTAPAVAGKTALTGAAIKRAAARKAAGGALADFASNTTANVTKKSLSEITGGKITGEILKNKMSAKDLATIENYDKSINALDTAISNFQKQKPRIKQGTEATAAELAKINQMNAAISPLERKIAGLKEMQKKFIDKVSNTLWDRIENEIGYTPFIPGLAGAAGGITQRGAMKALGDEFLDQTFAQKGFAGKNLFERTTNFLNQGGNREAPRDATNTMLADLLRPEDKLKDLVDSTVHPGAGKGK
jgi:hypothetical protein